MKAINSNQYALAKALIGYKTEVLDMYVHNKYLVLQLATCRFKILN